MKANEFVKKFGLDSAKTVINSMPKSATSYRMTENNALGLGGLYGRIDNINGNIISLNDLKSLVESHELVESYGGYEKALAIIQRDIQPLLSAALADVESCL